MARYTGPVCRLCRREDMKLFLKGDRCYTSKCAYERRAYPPGQHGQARRKRSDYRDQLREKQKVRRIYGLPERQFRGYYYRATRMRGVTGENLLALLERRLDSVVYRLGLSSTRSEARQLVRHRHFNVNGRTVDIPSYLVRPGDEIEVKEKSRKIGRINDALGAVDRRPVPSWLELQKEGYKGVIKAHPLREEFTLPIREQLIVELYSK
ncbi:MAG: 30S ribosomal protein S4 [Myxococcota bacterium]